MFSWTIIKHNTVLGFKALWLFIKGIYLVILFNLLRLYYLIFSPKGAEYIEDIPLLNKYNIKLDVWYFQASLIVGGLFSNFIPTKK